MSFNQVTVIGNLTRDPEVTFTPRGTAKAQLSLAVNRRWKSESGELKEEVTYLDIEAWGKTAEVIGKHFHKGSPIFVVGRLKTETWEDKTTHKKRSRLKIVLEQFEFIGGAKAKAAGEAPSASQPEPAPLPSNADLNESATEDDEKPF